MPSVRSRSRRRATSGTRQRGAVIPGGVREVVLARIEPEQQRYIASGAASGFAFEWKGEYLYIGSREGADFRGGQRRLSPLCRLRFTGDPERWGFEIYKHSDAWYDEDNEFPGGGGTPEYCFSVAADFYLWEYDAFEAGKSCGTVPEPTASGGFEGKAALLPACTNAEVPRPEMPPGAEAAALGALVMDLDAFLGFIANRSFELARRTMGFRQETLREVNALMRKPHELTQRPVQDRVPRVQVCFAVARALGLLDVDEPRHRATATGAMEEFQQLPDAERWWLALEALWQRVSWFSLRLDAHGSTERQQAGRFWLGEELARRKELVGRGARGLLVPSVAGCRSAGAELWPPGKDRAFGVHSCHPSHARPGHGARTVGFFGACRAVAQVRRRGDACPGRSGREVAGAGVSAPARLGRSVSVTRPQPSRSDGTRALSRSSRTGSIPSGTPCCGRTGSQALPRSTAPVGNSAPAAIQPRQQS